MRFKKIVVASVAGMVTLLVLLLIEGCVSEHAKTSTPAKDAVAAAPNG